MHLPIMTRLLVHHLMIQIAGTMTQRKARNQWGIVIERDLNTTVLLGMIAITNVPDAKPKNSQSGFKYNQVEPGSYE